MAIYSICDIMHTTHTKVRLNEYRTHILLTYDNALDTSSHTRIDIHSFHRFFFANLIWHTFKTHAFRYCVNKFAYLGFYNHYLFALHFLLLHQFFECYFLTLAVISLVCKRSLMNDCVFPILKIFEKNDVAITH